MFLKSNLYTVSLYARKIAGAFSVFVIARYLSVHDYGIYSSYSNIAAYLLIFACLGFNEYILVSSKNNVKDVRIKQGYFIIFALLLTFLYIFFSHFFPMEQKLIFKLILLKSFFDGTFFALALPYFQVSKKFIYIALINLFYSLGVFVIALISYLLKLSLVNFLILCVVLGVMNFIQCSVGTKINYLLALIKLNRFHEFIDSDFKYFAITALILVTQAQLYTVCISVSLPKEQAALFFAAFNVVNIIQLFAVAQIQQIMPEMMTLTGEKLKRSIIKAQKLLFSVFAFLIIFFVLFGKTLLHIIYSNDYYLNSYPILIVLSLVNLTNLAGIYGCAVSAKGMQKQKFKIQIQILLVAILAVFALFKFGMWGFICSYAVSSTFSFVRYFIFCKKQKFI